MPTPRAHGGAAVANFPLVVPGFKGLNTQAQGTLLGPEWATKLANTVIDSSGRVAARKGWEAVTTSAYSSAFHSGTQYKKADGTKQFVMVAADFKVLASTDGAAWSDVTGTAVFTSPHWYFVNFNDYLIGFQATEKALIYNGTACSQVADADAPTGGIGTAAFGRIWQTNSDNTALQYSALLDHTNWTATDVFDLTSVWPDNDTISAVAAFNNLLVVFGTHNIIVFSDPTGSDVGMTPSQMNVVDVIPGVGCYSQWSVQHVNGDLWFLDDSRELRSFNRVVIEQKSGALNKLSTNVSDRLRDSIDNGNFDPNNLRSAFSPRNRFYLLSLPTESTLGAADQVGSCFAFDTRGLLEDGSARCVGIWDQMVPSVLIPTSDGELYSTLFQVTGKLGKYIGGRDNSLSYHMIYESGWIDITQQQNYLLILKRLNGRYFFDIDTTVYMKWAFDFETTFHTKQLTFNIPGGSGLWGSGEWGIAEWGGGVDLQSKKVAGAGTGTYIKVGTEAVIDGGTFAIQQIDLLAKVGRLKG